MDVFNQQAKQQVLENLFALALGDKTASVSAIKLYLDLSNEQSPADSLTTARALEILRQANEELVILNEVKNPSGNLT